MIGSNTQKIATVGATLFMLAGCSGMMKNMMVQERQSPYGLDETVERITANAKAKSWIVSDVKSMEKSIKKHGGPELAPVRLLELCEPNHAAKLLAQDDTRWVSVMMPCTISVYQKSDGKVYIATMQARKVGNMMGGTIAEVMGGPVATAQESFVDFAVIQ